MAEIKWKPSKYIGKAWLNKTVKGEDYYTVSIDRGLVVTLTDKDRLKLWKNNKREGKKDADFCLTVQTDSKD